MDNSSHDETQQELQSRYSLVIAVAKRAKQLRDGAPSLVECRSGNPITCAMEEISQGKLKMVVPSPEEIEEQQHEAVSKPGIKEAAELLKVPEHFDIDFEDEAEEEPQAEESEETPGFAASDEEPALGGEEPTDFGEEEGESE